MEIKEWAIEIWDGNSWGQLYYYPAGEGEDKWNYEGVLRRANQIREEYGKIRLVTYFVETE